MSTTGLIVSTLKPIIPNTDTPPNVVPDVYIGKSKTFVVYNLSDNRGTNYEDDAPDDILSSWQIHLFYPKGYSATELKKQVREALFAAGFTFPAITAELYEESTNLFHTTFECDFIESEE